MCGRRIKQIEKENLNKQRQIEINFQFSWERYTDNTFFYEREDGFQSGSITFSYDGIEP